MARQECPNGHRLLAALTDAERKCWRPSWSGWTRHASGSLRAGLSPALTPPILLIVVSNRHHSMDQWLFEFLLNSLQGSKVGVTQRLFARMLASVA